MTDMAHKGATATDGATFHWAPARLFAAKFAVGLVGSVIGTAAVALVAGLLTGRMPEWLVIWLVIYNLGYPVAFACFSLLFIHGRPPRLRIGSAGVELAASRTDPVFIPWSAISSARFRWPGPLTYLEITTGDPAAVGTYRRGGRRPGRRRRNGLVSFVVDVGALRAAPASIRAELDRRGCPVSR